MNEPKWPAINSLLGGLLVIAIWQSRQVSCQLDNIEGATCPRTYMVYMSPEIMQFRQLCNSLGNCAIPGLLQIP
jgi:hypothetical protein